MTAKMSAVAPTFGSDNLDRMDVLLVEDNDDHFELISLQLDEEDPAIRLNRCISLTAAQNSVSDTAFDLVLLDLGLPESDGLATLEAAFAFLGSTPVFVLTSAKNICLGLEAVSRGAADFVDKHSLHNAGLARRIFFAVERAEINRRLERQNAFLKTFVACVGHDLRAPPRQIVQIAEAIEGSGAVLGSEISKGLHDIKSRAEHLSALLTDTLDYATQASRQPRHETLRLSEEVMRVALDLDEDLRDRITVERDARLIADPALFFLVLRNLIANGLKYWKKAPSKVNVLGLERQSGTEVIVSDTGMGIAPAMIDRVFEPTVRAVTGKEFTGTGFGLAIVKLLIDAHDGEISVCSELEKGTMVKLFLPRC